jgi:hypothetical protein
VGFLATVRWPSTATSEIVLIDGLHGDEEVVNERLGNAAPLLNVVGGSAADDLAFQRTWCERRRSGVPTTGSRCC